LHVTERERAFWDSFGKNHPAPPEEIVRQQLETADGVLATTNTPLGSASEARIRESIRTEPFTKFNYPKEAFSEDTLFWSYVMDERQKYPNLTDQGQASGSLSQPFIRHLRVPTNYLTDPLPEQASAASDWKIAYLQRLEKENTDSSYINAYLKAW